MNQMQARGVLQAVRADAVLGVAGGDKERSLSVSNVRAYASLLGDEIAEEYADEHFQSFQHMEAAPMKTKRAAYEAYQLQRSAKDHDRKVQDRKKKKKI